MEASLLRLMEHLVESLDERDTEPDEDAGEALRRGLRVRRLEVELARRLAATAGRREPAASDTRDGELAAVS